MQHRIVPAGFQCDIGVMLNHSDINAVVVCVIKCTDNIMCPLCPKFRSDQISIFLKITTIILQCADLLIHLMRVGFSKRHKEASSLH